MTLLKHVDFEVPAFGELPAGVSVKPGYPALVAALGPVACWRLGDSTGSVVVDAAGGTNGAYVGGVTLGQPGALALNPDIAARFDGVTGHVDLGNTFESLFAGVSPFSISAHFKLDSQASSIYPMILARSADWQGVQVFINAPNVAQPGRVVFRRARGSTAGNFVDAYTDAAVTVGQWHHVACVFDGGWQRVYLDGGAGAAAVGGAVIVGGVSYTSPSRRLQLAARDAGNALRFLFPGSLDEVALFNRALSEAEVRALYLTGAGR